MNCRDRLHHLGVPRAGHTLRCPVRRTTVPDRDPPAAARARL